jgi:monoamine oxidase
MKQLEAQFCVVGAGISGLTAAYRLSDAGATVVVLEAGDRIGGRMFSARLSDGTPFEIGAEWISDDSLQPSVRALMRDLEEDTGTTFPTFEQYVRGNSVFVDFDGSAKQYNAIPPEDDLTATGLPPISDAAQAEIVEAFAALGYMSAIVNREARWVKLAFDTVLSGGVANTVEADRVTIHNWLESNFEEPAAKALIAALFRGTMGLEPEALSLLHAIFFLNTFGCNPLNVIGAQKGQSQYLRLTNGVSQIIEAMASVIGSGSIFTGSPVQNIEQFKDHVIVRSGSVEVKAKRVIVATSIAAANLIRFQPPLLPDRAQLQQRMGLGSFWKIWLSYDTPFWRRNGLSGAITCVKKDAYVATTLDSSASDDGPGLMTCFIDADKARAFAHLSYEDRRGTILDEMVRAFGPEAATLSETILFPAAPPQVPEPTAYFEWNWSLPDFIRGDYAGAPGPGVYTAVGFGPAIHGRFRRVHWAGSDNGQECYGSMTGAVWAGNRAAREALELDPVDGSKAAETAST